MFPLMILRDTMKQRAFYILSLPLEYYGLLLAEVADSILSGKFMDSEPTTFSNIYMVSKIKLLEVEKIAKAFSQIWFSSNITIDNLFDIISNLTAHQPESVKSSIVAYLASMFWAKNNKCLQMEQRKKLEEIDQKLGEVVFQRLNLTFDLDEDVIDLFLENIEANKDPIQDERLRDRLIQYVDPPDGKVPMFSNLLSEYLNAVVLKKRDRKFIVKVYAYQKGNHGMLIRMFLYEEGVKPQGPNIR